VGFGKARGTEALERITLGELNAFSSIHDSTARQTSPWVERQQQGSAGAPD
jgi:hypothetical protein